MMDFFFITQCAEGDYGQGRIVAICADGDEAETIRDWLEVHDDFGFTFGICTGQLPINLLSYHDHQVTAI